MEFDLLGLPGDDHGRGRNYNYNYGRGVENNKNINYENFSFFLFSFFSKFSLLLFSVISFSLVFFVSFTFFCVFELREASRDQDWTRPVRTEILLPTCRWCGVAWVPKGSQGFLRVPKGS